MQRMVREAGARDWTKYGPVEFCTAAQQHARRIYVDRIETGDYANRRIDLEMKDPDVPDVLFRATVSVELEYKVRLHRGD